MELLQQRLQEVAEFFANNDTVLGYRKLMDRAMDTQDMSIYKEVIALTDWRENNLNNDTEFISKCIVVLGKIAAIPIDVCDTTAALIQASDVTKIYGSSGFMLGTISLSIRKGNVYGLVGENGNGKT
ncbi:MAG: ABC transporter ATP-binding protein, partial [Nonlabens sp.]|nr:ABC transporter ATP-binding protein [Nonlabens sp.]